jgi:hypothetical protein
VSRGGGWGGEGGGLHLPASAQGPASERGRRNESGGVSRSVGGGGDAGCYGASDPCHIKHNTYAGGVEVEVEVVCTLDTHGGVLAAFLGDRIVYVAQECGEAFVVTRTAGSE